ncbi:Hypothetical predicted protein [Mytilus galloprovincialis]|uniref:Uncharacterized protein n=1 Tax=Mytilus galloprovincialis TaxID=29158 RepID=A0A8B6BE12_MYTGA|nr:Hypothetical predicted protein [Mytilus galloprovincialis]
MKIVLFLVLFCIVTYCNASDRQGEGVNWRGKRAGKIIVHFSLPNCKCTGYEGVNLRGKRAGKITVNLSLTNCKCKGYEGGGHGPGPRPFRIVCNKEKKNSIANDCTFTGNPHRCSDYNNKNQKKFYKELIAAIAPTQCGNLNLPGRPCPTGTFNTKKTCNEIDYKLE